MQNQNDLAINLLNLFEASSYKGFDEGFFVNKPKMKGFYYIFKNMRKPKFCLIVNNNGDFNYPSNMSKINDYVFIVFNTPSLEDFLNNLADKYFPQLMEILDTEMEKKNERNLPYGYYLDENGKLKIDLKKADEVRRIYNLYIEKENVRDVAKIMNSDFSKIREILHDNEEYMQMREKIISISKLKEVAELMATNVRGGSTAKRTIEDEIREVRARRKNLNKNAVN